MSDSFRGVMPRYLPSRKTLAFSGTERTSRLLLSCGFSISDSPGRTENPVSRTPASSRMRQREPSGLIFSTSRFVMLFSYCMMTFPLSSLMSSTAVALTTASILTPDSSPKEMWTAVSSTPVILPTTSTCEISF